jgi:hypothetical protein
LKKILIYYKYIGEKFNIIKELVKFLDREKIGNLENTSGTHTSPAFCGPKHSKFRKIQKNDSELRRFGHWAQNSKRFQSQKEIHTPVLKNVVHKVKYFSVDKD